MQYVAVFHANLNYAYLVPERYEFVIRSSYELLIDTMRERFPDTAFVFEASGYTLEHIAEKTPDVLDKLRAAIALGQCEFMGSPYAHPMLPNFPEEDGRWTIRFSNEVSRPMALSRTPSSESRRAEISRTLAWAASSSSRVTSAEAVAGISKRARAMGMALRNMRSPRVYDRTGIAASPPQQSCAMIGYGLA